MSAVAHQQRGDVQFSAVDGEQHDRGADVEFRVVAELLLCLCTIPIVLIWLLSLFGPQGAWLLPLLVAAIAWSTWTRWHERLRRWRLLTSWQRFPVRCEGRSVIQEDANGRCIGRIDTTDHYTVTWERFDSRRALYLVTQGDQSVTISTLSPDAPQILVDALRVRNYPCEEWPNFDL